MVVKNVAGWRNVITFFPAKIWLYLHLSFFKSFKQKVKNVKVTQINYVSRNQLQKTANGCQILNFGLSWPG